MTMKTLLNPRKLALTSCLISLIVLSGCSTTPPAVAPTSSATFFPPAPDTPRIQYLTAFGSASDLGKSSGFADFITGGHQSAGPLVKPYGIAVHDGKIFVCDTVGSTIEEFDLRKNQTTYFSPMGEGKLRLPINITVDQDGTRYVTDTGREQILVYRADGSFLKAIGRKDEFRPVDVGVTADRLYVTDLKNHCVKVLNKADDSLLFTIPAAGSSQGKLLSPTDIAIDRQNGKLLVSDIGGTAVQVYDLDGKYVRTIGGAGVAPGRFARPKGVAVDRQGLAYVVDAATQVVQLFDTEGRLLMFFGQAGASTRGEVLLPAAVKVDYDNLAYFQKFVAPGKQIDYLIFVTSQFGGQKVSVYGFLKQ